jgi:hypothetical protein
MKRVIGILVILSMLTSASFGLTVWKGNVEDKLVTATTASDYVLPGETVSLTTAPWQLATVPVGMTSNTAPWAGIYLSTQTDGNIWQYTCEARMADQYGMVLDVDTDLGDGTLAGYRHGTSTTAVYNVLGKWSGKNGTVNMNGHTIYVDGLQAGTVSRLSYNTAYPEYTGQYTINMDAGSKIVVMGSAQYGYGVNVDAYLNITNAEFNNDFAGKIFTFGAANSGAGQTAAWRMEGASALITCDQLKLNQQATCVQTLTFVIGGDDTGQVDISTSMLMGVDSRLDLQLTSIPVSNTPILLFNLENATAVIGGGNSGKFKRTTAAGGGTIYEGDSISILYGGVYYAYKISYKGGTGNDVIATLVPEPATVALLSLGGLVLVRRRRA